MATQEFLLGNVKGDKGDPGPPGPPGDPGSAGPSTAITIVPTPTGFTSSNAARSVYTKSQFFDPISGVAYPEIIITVDLYNINGTERPTAYNANESVSINVSTTRYMRPMYLISEAFLIYHTSSKRKCIPIAASINAGTNAIEFTVPEADTGSAINGLPRLMFQIKGAVEDI